MVDISDEVWKKRTIAMNLGYVFKDNDYYKIISIEIVKLLYSYKSNLTVSKPLSDAKLSKFCSAAEYLCRQHEIRVTDFIDIYKDVEFETRKKKKENKKNNKNKKENTNAKLIPPADRLTGVNIFSPAVSSTINAGSLDINKLRYPNGLDAIIALPYFLLDMLLEFCNKRYEDNELLSIIESILNYKKCLFVYHTCLDLLVYIELENDYVPTVKQKNNVKPQFKNKIRPELINNFSRQTSINSKK